MLSALPSSENEVSPLLNPLRSVSALALIASYFVVRRIIVAQSTTGEAVGRRGSSQDGTDVTAHAVVAANVCLFPVHFFFSALFYTDTLSVLLVVLAFANHDRGWRLVSASWGYISLTMRQTNVFWTGLYLAAREALKGLETGENKFDKKTGGEVNEVLRGSWREGVLFYPLLRNAYFEGTLALTALSESHGC